MNRINRNLKNIRYNQESELVFITQRTKGLLIVSKFERNSIGYLRRVSIDKSIMIDELKNSFSRIFLMSVRDVYILVRGFLNTSPQIFLLLNYFN